MGARGSLPDPVILVTENGSLLDTLTDTLRFRVSTATGCVGVGLLRLGEITSLMDNLCLSVAACTSSSRSSDGNSSLPDEGGSASQVPQASVQLAGYGSVVWPDSLSEWLVGGAELQQMFCCLTASTARALLCMANAEFGIQVIVEAVVACPEPEYCNLYKIRSLI